MINEIKFRNCKFENVYFDNIYQKILSAIEESNKSIHLAMYMITDYTLINALEKAKARGVEVQMVLDDNQKNRKGLTKHNFNITWINSKSFSNENKMNIFHNKFCVFDETIVFAGSYNWTYQARSNHEHIFISDEKNIVEKFLKNFFTYRHN